MRRWAQSALGLLLLLEGSAGPSTVAPGGSQLSRAYAFLDGEMDRYATGASLRLVQSYVPTSTFSNGDISYTYDDAVMLIALLARGTPDDIARAKVLGDSLVYAQEHDPVGDGRLRDAYHAKQFIGGDGAPNIANAASHTGNVAWAGMALAQLSRATGAQSYRDAALALATFMQRNTYDTRGGIGGYTGGFDGNDHKIEYKSTEHNIDIYAFLTMLDQLTGDATRRAQANHALKLIAAMWDADKGFFWIGTGLDGASINKSDPVPEDVQTWSFLATRSAQYQSSIGWALAHLSATIGAFQGLSFAINDRSGVWFEGTAHAAAALRARNAGSDAQKAATLIADVERGQARAPNANGSGIDAASKDGLRTGDGAGDAYYAALHIGATAWYALAQQSKNPFRLLPQH
jgi:hypothetical protein